MDASMTEPNPLSNAAYMRSVHNPEQLPPDGGREVAIAGRSNAGKSSAINAIVGRRGLARASKTPGRTQLVNFFTIGPERFLVDLPGYGYAKVPLPLRAHWQGLIDGYFRSRQALVGLVVVMDIRHPLKEFDRLMLDYAAARGLPAHALLTKADKLPRGQQAKALQAVRNEMRGGRVGVQLFSSTSKLGVDEARAVLAGWLQLGGGNGAER
jgi:GTP-binding protein